MIHVAKKKREKSKIKIEFLGNSSVDVTGSMILITTEHKTILLECGIKQSSNSIEDYKTNSKPFPFKPKNVDYLFINHVHADHCSLTPKLVREGFDGKIITSDITFQLMRCMLMDSAKIIRKDAEYISHKRGKEVYPYYDEDDVDNALSMVNTYDYNIIYELDNTSFRLLHNSHIVGAFQLELFIKTSTGKVEKIFYSSDLGGFKFKNHYVDENDKCIKSNIVISESTYGAREKNNKPDRNKDLEKIKTTINQVCIEGKGKLLIPVFSLSRSHQMLTDLYLLYGQDKDFKLQIVVDSPLIWELTKIHKEMFEGENKELFEKVCNWKNVKFIKDHNESLLSVKDKTPKIVLSSSGFLIKGRSINYLKEYITQSNCGLLFCGYAPPTSIAGKIKSGQKYITIERVSYKNKCSITCLNSYSSHIPRYELINYLKGIQADKIYLLHGDMQGKLQLKESLDEELSNLCKSTRVICTNKNTVCNI